MGGSPGIPKTQKAPTRRAFLSGARRIRTADLLGAIQALCQLSYSPESGGWEERPRTLASARITA